MDSRVASRESQNNGSTSFCSTSDDDSDIEADLVSTINYHTISSVSALKDMLRSEEEGGSNFFHRYFQNHSGSLPSRMAAGNRRLSQCREEDEDEEKRDFKETAPSASNISAMSGSDKSLSESSSGSKVGVRGGGRFRLTRLEADFI